MLLSGVSKPVVSINVVRFIYDRQAVSTGDWHGCNANVHVTRIVWIQEDSARTLIQRSEEQIDAFQ